MMPPKAMVRSWPILLPKAMSGSKALQQQGVCYHQNLVDFSQNWPVKPQLEGENELVMESNKILMDQSPASLLSTG